MASKSYSIKISDFLGGFAPGWYLDQFPVYGNKNMAGDMKNVDLTNPSSITQGPGLSTLTNGDENGNVTDLIKGILDRAQATNLSFAVGSGGQFYELSSGSVNTNATPALPHTIAGTNPVGEDVAYFQGEIYYSHYDDSAGDVGKYDLTRDAETDFDDDWCSVVAGGTIQKAVPLPLEVGGTVDTLFLGNKNKISSWNGSTWTNDDLSLPQNAVIQDLKWTNNRLYIAANQPDLSGDNKVIGSIFIWDGAADYGENEIRVGGRVSGLHVKNGVLYVFYEDLTTTGGYKLGYLDGTRVRELAHFKGSLPSYYQITDFKNLILWVGGGLIYAYGAVHKDLSGMVFQLADGGYATVSGLASPFGTPMVASHDASTAYKIAEFSGYDTTSYWKSLMFASGEGEVAKVKVYFDTPSTGAKVDVKITRDRGTETITLATISTTDQNSLSLDAGIKVYNDFRVELDWSNGSTSNNFSVNRIEIIFHSKEL